MANRNYNRVQALEKESKHLYAEVAIGTSGAPTLTKALGIASIARDAAGTYTLTLQDKYTRLLYCDVVHFAASAEDITTQLKAQDVSSAKTIEFFTKTAGAAADASSGSKLYIHVALKNSSVGE